MLDVRSRYFDPVLETMPRAEIERLQADLLGEALEFMEAHSPVVRARWSSVGISTMDVQTMEEFRAVVPFMSKDTIRGFRDRTGDPLGGLAEWPEVGSVTSSSGTTGDPILLPSRRAAYGEPVRLAADFWEMGCRPGDAIAVMLFTFRGAPMLAPHSLGGATVLFDHSPAELERFCRASLELRPTGLYTMSGPLILALRAAEQTLGFDLKDVFSSYCGVVYAGEPLGTRGRDDLGRWGIEHFSHTAVGDVDSATECKEHDGHHCHDDQVLIEVLDPSGDEPRPEGQVGELVVTTLNPQAANMLVRYRSEDLVRTTTEPCGCGRTSTRLWTVGRKGDEVVVAGTSVLPVDVWLAVEQIEETSAGLFQLIRNEREMERLRLRVGYDQSVTTRAPSALSRAVAESVARSVGVEPEVELVENAELLKLGPPHKIPRVAKS